MKKFVLIACLCLRLFANDSANDEPIKIKDTSGLNEDEIRKKAKQSQKSKKVSINKVIKATDAKGKVDITKVAPKWEELSPDAKQYDWIQTKSKEWFKGKIKAMYNDKLEFDSKEIGVHMFDFSDVVQIKTYQLMSVNIEDVAIIDGVIRFKDNKITIIQGNARYIFARKQIISFAPKGEKEKDFWSGKVTLSFDKSTGNKDLSHYSGSATLKRRTAKTKLEFDYLGRLNTTNGQESANDHRLNGYYDIYIDRHLFWTPIFGEYYTNEFKNIASQYTVGVGIGYTVTDTKKLSWDLTAGPSYLHTTHVSTSSSDKESSSLAFELGTDVDYELTKVLEIKYTYKLTYTDNESGLYKHHMVLTFENDLTDWLDLDITTIWDYIAKPKEESDNTVPKRSDFQFMIGLGVEF